jgi:hypothetical protein
VPQDNQLFSTSDWVEICRTTDEWESKLVQTTLGNQHIRCRPTYDRDSDGKRQIVLSVSREDQIDALEVVSNIDLVLADEASPAHEETVVFEDNHRDFRQENEPPKAAPTALEEVTIAEREGIGRIIHYLGRGYELQVGPDPYGIVEENRWEEFIDLSAQRQEFSMLLRHEYLHLFQWLRGQKLMSEFIRLVESTYREVPPPRHRNRQRNTTSSPDTSSFAEAAVRISPFALVSLGLALISLLTVFFHFQWYAAFGLSLLAVITGIVAKHHINSSDGALKGGLIAILAVIIACIAILIALKPSKSSDSEVSNRQSTLLFGNHCRNSKFSTKDTASLLPIEKKYDKFRRQGLDIIT